MWVFCQSVRKILTTEKILGLLRNIFLAVTLYALDLLENKLSLDDMFRGSQGIGDVMSDMWKQNSNNKSAAISQAGISYNSGQSQSQVKSVKVTIS